MSSLNGVRGVSNQLTLGPTIVDANQIRSSIEAALKRQSEREARHIEIGVNDGVITLSGTVRSWAERKAIEGVALFAPGVRHLDNKLVVDSFS